VLWDDDMDKFTVPWLVCPSCHQNYQNELRIDIANKFVLIVRRQYPDDTRRQVEALYLKLRALGNMFKRLQPVQKREAGVTANVLLSLINRMRVVAPLTRRYSQLEAFAYYTHGNIALDEETEESARRAVIHFESQLEVYESIDDVQGVACAKGGIAIAKSKYEGGNNKEMLKASQELYELRIAEYGDEHYYTIDAGMRYAYNLRKVKRETEVRDLLTKLLVTSKRVLGPHHNTTKAVDNAIIWINFITFIKSSVFVVY
jgi:hypothetical protein